MPGQELLHGVDAGFRGRIGPRDRVPTLGAVNLARRCGLPAITDLMGLCTEAREFTSESPTVKACGVDFPLATAASTCRSSVTIRSGLYRFIGIPASLQSGFSLTLAGTKNANHVAAFRFETILNASSSPGWRRLCLSCSQWTLP